MVRQSLTLYNESNNYFISLNKALTKLSPREYMVLGALNWVAENSYTNLEGEALTINEENFAKSLDISQKTLNRALIVLQDLDFVLLTSNGEYLTIYLFDKEYGFEKEPSYKGVKYD